MLNPYRRARSEARNPANRFLQSVQQRGGRETARSGGYATTG